jgi:hypothetical protein
MDVEFNTIFVAIGWRNLVPINESGVKLLTMDFAPCKFLRLGLGRVFACSIGSLLTPREDLAIC